MMEGMARQLRIQAPGLSYHVWARGTGRMAIFLDDRDRHHFLELLGDVFDSHGVDCHAHCQMTNHYHLVITTSDANLSRVVKRVNGLYAQWWNRRHDRVGHAFQGRFGAQIIQDDAYLLTACRYVVLNPVRAGLVRHPREWPWSSYCATAGLAPIPRHLKPEGLWARLGDGSPEGSWRRYDEFVDAWAADGRGLPRERVLGDAMFLERFKSWRQSASRDVPRREREPPRPELASFFVGAVSRAERGRRASLACDAGFSLKEVAHYLELHYTTVARMMRDGVSNGVRSCEMQYRRI
jgi:putative transposase